MKLNRKRDRGGGTRVAGRRDAGSRGTCGGDQVLCSNGFQAVMQELARNSSARRSTSCVVVSLRARGTAQAADRGGENRPILATSRRPRSTISSRPVKVAAGLALGRWPRTGLGDRHPSRRARSPISPRPRRLLAALLGREIDCVCEGGRQRRWHSAALIQRLGIAGDLKAGVSWTATGEEVSRRRSSAATRSSACCRSAEILSRFAASRVLGTLPPDVQSYIVMVAGAGASATQAAPPETRSRSSPRQRP